MTGQVAFLAGLWQLRQRLTAEGRWPAAVGLADDPTPAGGAISGRGRPRSARPLSAPASIVPQKRTGDHSSFAALQGAG